MRTEKRPDGWWIVNCPPGVAAEGFPGVGPYRTRQEAEDDRRGLERCLRDLEK